MLTVFGFPNSRSLRITWMLEELGQPYNYQLVDFTKGGNRAPEYLAVNPAGKVPALLDGDQPICESGAIVTHLADKFPEAGLIPKPGITARGRHEQWSYFAVCELEQPLWTIGKAKFALPEAQRVPAILPTAAWEFQKALALFSEGLGKQDYILGDRFQAADILLGHTLIWANTFKHPIEQANLQAYMERIVARPALAAARQREQSAMPAA